MLTDDIRSSEAWREARASSRARVGYHDHRDNLEWGVLEWGVLPSAKRPEGRAARGRPGNVWQANWSWCTINCAL